jgi:hypothetical protein
MTEPELKKLYESARGFEDVADQANDAAQLKAYCESHVRCINHHHRPKADEDNPCPVCHSLIPYLVEKYPA